MKILALILIFTLSVISTNAETGKKLKDLRPLKFPKHLQTLNISASSSVSYEEAMNRLARMTPDGYSIASLRYVKTKGNYIVVASLRKCG